MIRIVGSLTTLPDRIEYIKPVIDSILNQGKRLDCLYLNIPYKTMKGKMYTIPQFVKEYHGNGKIIINRCKDYGSITKLLPTIVKENGNNSYIITFDDDLIVDKKTIRLFSYNIKKFPNSALSFSGLTMGKFPTYFNRYFKTRTPKSVDWLQGNTCICYPSFLLNKKEILNFTREFPNSFKKHDDHLISAYLSFKNIPRIVIPCIENFFTNTHFRRNSAISGTNLIQRIKFFLELWYIAFSMSSKGYYKERGEIKESYLIYVLFVIFLYILYRKNS